MIIFDESARYIKTYNTQRTIASIILADHAKFKLILTGTPIANRPMDLWSQFRALDGGETFGTNFFKFRGWFFRRRALGRFTTYEVNKERRPILHKKIYINCIKKSKSEVFKSLPEKIFQAIHIPLVGRTKDVYKKIEEKILSEIETMEGQTEVKVTNILTKLLRLQQVTSGFVNNSELIHTPKLDALEELVDQILYEKESLVIWCRFIKSIDLISKRLDKKKIKHITMSGKDGKDKYDKWKGFQKSKSKNIFIGQVESGGIGIELFKHDNKSRAQHMCFYENTWSMDTRVQAIDRIHRIGQKSEVCMYWDLIVEKSIDEKILDTFNRNKKIADEILEGGVRKWLN